MKIELKNIQVQEQLSEETYCYSASVYLDGKRIGMVSNRGHGGCDQHDFSYGLVKLMDEYLKANNEPEIFQGMTMEYDFERFCSDAVSQFLIAKDFKKACRTNFFVLATPAGEKRGVYQYKIRQADKELIKRGDTDFLIGLVRGWIGDDKATVLNFAEDGLQLYTEATQR